jgi:hypothetical protein
MPKPFDATLKTLLEEAPLDWPALAGRAQEAAEVKGVVAMEESVTYQAILAEGALEEARKMVLLSGSDRFGTPTGAIKKALHLIADLERLERLQVRLLKARSWEELLDLPRRATGKRKRKA